MRQPSYRLASYYAALAQQPYGFDYHATLRWVQALSPDAPPLGKSLRAADDPIRLAQQPAMTFAPAALADFTPASERAPARLQVRFFGLLGPNGPLPLHLTEFAVQRKRHHGDESFARFLDVFHHRWLSIFHRAWVQASPTASLDRPADDRFSHFVGALVGYGQPELRGRQSVADLALQHFAGLLSRGVRHVEGLAAMLTAYFAVPVRVEPLIGHWMPLHAGDRTRLGAAQAGAQLGGGATLGARVWDRQHKLRIVLGPLSLARYRSFLPGGVAGKRLHDWMHAYFGHGMDSEVRLVLQRTEVPRAALGASAALGWTSWCGTGAGDRGELVLDMARYARVDAARTPEAAA
ncbi:MAG: type VI secretion system baseplate subunit TssG [Betaproteobacteria bacterium]|nr:type VI secretion system baseplate subunit TssG [Betaproteobacteria bacterium]